MSRGNSKKRNQQGRRGNSRPNGQAESRPGASGKGTLPTSPKEIAKELPAAMEEAAEAAGGTLPEPVTAPEGTDFLSATKLWEEVTRLKGAYEAARERVQDAETQSESRSGKLDQRDDELHDRELALAAKESRLQQDRDKIAEREADLRTRIAKADQRDTELTVREEEEKNNASSYVRDALRQAREELDAQREEITAERSQVRQRAIKLEQLQEDLDDARELQERKVADKVSQEVGSQHLQMELLQKRAEGLLQDNQRLQAEIADYERARRAQPGGDYDPGQLLADLQRLKDENKELRARQAPADLMTELDRLRDAEQTWREDRAMLVQETELLNKQLAAFHISAFERDRLEHVNSALEATAESYKDEVDRLREQADGLRRKAEGTSPFPECAKMDAKYKGTADGMVSSVIQLPEFLSDLRNYLAHEDGLFYSETDLRVFVAGMAATRLHILQGVSGIGKTQLPLSFAKVIGAQAETVAVGADWRTPQELTGYYNAFERRFYESDFTQAIYKANCPQYRQQPFFVVLDEMNLSHPEQYFSEVLSVLERKAAKDKVFALMTTEVTPAPQWLRDGRLLPLPDNVWFVGTANQDETTVGFAEKTLDRSNVLELPSRPERFVSRPVAGPPAYSLSAWRETFQRAADSHEAQAARVARFLQGDLATRLHTDFRIGIGPRSLDQLKHFVATFVAAGGTVGEAADHVLALKVLRKVRGRYEFRRDKIAALRDELPGFWAELGDCGLDLPGRSIQLLDDELHERGEN